MRMLVIILFLLSSCASTVRQTSVDVGSDLGSGVYPYVGVSMPAGPLWVSGGIWRGLDGLTGTYMTVNYSFQPFVK